MPCLHCQSLFLYRLRIPLTPNSGAKYIADTIERATPTTLGYLKARGIEKTWQRIADKAIVDATAKGFKPKKFLSHFSLDRRQQTTENCIHNAEHRPYSFLNKYKKGVNPPLSKSTVEAVI